MASKVTGVEDVVRSIQALGRTVKPAVRTGSVFALSPIKSAAKANLIANGSKHRGVLYNSIAVRPVKTNGKQMTHQVAAMDKGNSIAHLVEFGTEPHWQPKRNRMHPGADPKPFLTPAYAQHDDEAVRRFNEKIMDALMKQLTRASR